MIKVIVFGASGQLGQCLQHLSKGKSLDIQFLPEEKANILDKAVLSKVFKEYTPDYCINCAAYTAVDKAEDEVELCRKINRDGVYNLTQLCKESNTTLIHVSTDFVFEGKGSFPLIETDEANPINVYGLTKLEGEEVIQKNIENYFILRTSWLYSPYANNFVKTMLKLGRERSELKVIWDQFGTPTYAIDLADCILQIIETQSTKYGLYHYSNEGVTSWYDFAKAIFEIGGISIKVIPVRTTEYVTKAIRPAFSVMDKSKIKQSLHIAIPHWRESLTACIETLKEEHILQKSTI